MIYVVHPRLLEMLPPLVSLLRLLKDRGEDVTYVGLLSTPATLDIIREIGVDHRIYPCRFVKFRDAPLERIKQRLTVRLRPYLKRRWLWRTLAELGFDPRRDILWSVEMEGAAILGDRALACGKRHVQTFYELGDHVGSDLRGFDIAKMYHAATLLECEYNRAHILRAENGLGRLPFVMPNKPYAHPRTRGVPVTDAKAAEVVRGWQGKRVFLYQGSLASDRGELFTLIDTLCCRFPDAIVAVMGQETAAVKALKEKYGNFSYVPFVRAPHHLEVTSHADVGLAYYQGGVVYGLSPLNPVYCAPNKIFEYSGFGLPMLCNDMPGLMYTVGINGFGECLADFSRESVGCAASKIMSQYEKYSKAATDFFDSVDLNKIVENVLAFARGEGEGER